MRGWFADLIVPFAAGADALAVIEAGVRGAWATAAAFSVACVMLLLCYSIQRNRK